MTYELRISLSLGLGEVAVGRSIGISIFCLQKAFSSPCGPPRMLPPKLEPGRLGQLDASSQGAAPRRRLAQDVGLPTSLGAKPRPLDEEGGAVCLQPPEARPVHLDVGRPQHRAERPPPMNADREVGVRPRGVGRPPRRERMAGRPVGGLGSAPPGEHARRHSRVLTDSPCPEEAVRNARVSPCPEETQ